MDGDEGKDSQLPFTVRQLRAKADSMEGRMVSVEGDVRDVKADVHDMKTEFLLSKRFLFGWWDPDSGKQIPGVSQQIADTRSDIGATKDIALRAEQRAGRVESLGTKILWAIVCSVGVGAINVAVNVISHAATGGK